MEVRSSGADEGEGLTRVVQALQEGLVLIGARRVFAVDGEGQADLVGVAPESANNLTLSVVVNRGNNNEL